MPRPKKQKTKYIPGDYIIIQYNVHVPGAEDIVGVITEILPKTGFRGTAMYNVTYTYEQTEHESPFAELSIKRATLDKLQQLENRYSENIREIEKARKCLKDQNLKIQR